MPEKEFTEKAVRDIRRPTPIGRRSIGKPAELSAKSRARLPLRTERCVIDTSNRAASSALESIS